MGLQTSWLHNSQTNSNENTSPNRVAMQFRLCFSKFVPVGPGRGFIFEILALVRDMLQGPLIYLASFFQNSKLVRSGSRFWREKKYWVGQRHVTGTVDVCRMIFPNIEPRSSLKFVCIKILRIRDLVSREKQQIQYKNWYQCILHQIACYQCSSMALLKTRALVSVGPIPFVLVCLGRALGCSGPGRAAKSPPGSWWTQYCLSWFLQGPPTAQKSCTGHLWFWFVVIWLEMYPKVLKSMKKH